MRIPRRAISGEVGFNMTPMIDVVFQLIIFFLVNSHIAKQEAHMKLALPLATSANEDVDPDSPRVTLHVDASGQVFLAARPITSDDLLARLQTRKAELGENRALEVRIRGDRRVPYRFVEPLLVACAEVGVWNVQYSVYDRRDAAAANRIGGP